MKTSKIIGFFLILLGVIWIGKGFPQTSRLTSDSGETHLPMPPSGIFVPPADSIFIEFRTNLTALVVRQEVTSNVIRRTFWMSHGQRFTNDALVTNHLISVTTNNL